MGDPAGSVWRRWDPHLHAPGTSRNDQFGSASFDDYLSALESAVPQLAAIGITDYFSTYCYERIVEERAKGRLSQIGLVFPNVELRLSIGTKAHKAINLHLLVSPDDPEHVRQTARFLARLSFRYLGEDYGCTRDDLIRLGRAHDSSLVDDSAAYSEGVNQFKVDFNELQRQVNRSTWVQENVLFAVAGSSNDGTAGMQDGRSSFAAQRVEIESFSHIVFASADKQVRFWLGEGVLDRSAIETKYRSLKPCMHGSDAHTLEKVARADGDRFTWIKGDATFDALRQACIEPCGRVHIGPEAPIIDSSDRACVMVQSHGAPWLVEKGLPINPGLVAVIGARGSGKTALVDLIARGAGSTAPLTNDRSFVRRAAALISDDVESSVTWSSGQTERHALGAATDTDDNQVHYLSQQFVERLCSADGPNDELIREIEKVVFASYPMSDRLGATNFRELLGARTGHMKSRRDTLRSRLDRIADEVLAQRELQIQLRPKERKRDELSKLRQDDVTARSKLVRRGEVDRAEYYERLKSAIDDRNQVLQTLETRVRKLEQLRRDAESHESEVFPDMHAGLRASYDDVIQDGDLWSALEIRFRGAWQGAVKAESDRAVADMQAAKRGSASGVPTIRNSADELKRFPLLALTTALEDLGKEIGLDRDAARKLVALDQRIAQRQQEIERIEKEISACQGADGKLKVLMTERSEAYQSFFETVVEEESALRSLYGPLEQHLSSASEIVGRLKLVVVRRVDIDAWAAHGEELIDLRKSGEFKGRGTLSQYAHEMLMPAWESGSAEQVSKAMSDFRAKYDGAILSQSLVDRSSGADYRKWTIDVGRWLYSTDHIQVTYSFEFDGVKLSQLSPGSRGVVLLLLYLALDTEDDRPLIIDQPEENLDPRTIFADLVALFGEARKRRQVIMVTHNANLVVNTDVDQVIVASSERTSANVPRFSYRSGGLEDPTIRADVCEILEGGREAFLERARRLRVVSGR